MKTCDKCNEPCQATPVRDCDGSGEVFYEYLSHCCMADIYEREEEDELT